MILQQAQQRGRNRYGHRHAAGGFSLVELMVVFTIMTIALSMFSRTLTSASKLDPLSRERSLAAEAAKNVAETMYGYDFSEIFVSFNADGSDDPGGAGTAHGNTFTVDGLEAISKTEPVGQIIFCDTEGVIREDAEIEEFGLPRDLNGDGIVDKGDHTSDCIILPYKILVQWKSRHGNRKFELYGVRCNL